MTRLATRFTGKALKAGGLSSSMRGKAISVRGVSPRAQRGGAVGVYAFKITINTPNGEEVIECDENTYLLDAAEEAGVELPWSCRAGACSSCTAKTGDADSFDQSDQTFLGDQQIDAGYVLTCVAYPTKDTTITSHVEDELY
ncbi:ferredoxin [Chloropicon primus]|uniref:Ferredoxin n=1 Tax=Chloropicon primus TaxID=1764295 RepID=A0A5B8MYR2_9CHLO|nr:ferredoxin [Chloropicon primus]|eukprot:QDZ24772.1 ferredoxin [Chloropicon primus]